LKAAPATCDVTERGALEANLWLIEAAVRAATHRAAMRAATELLHVHVHVGALEVAAISGVI